MIPIECQIGILNKDLVCPSLFMEDAQGRIGNHFIQASGGDIELQMHAAQPVQDFVGPNDSVTALDLHVALARLIGYPSPPSSKIGLLLAHSYSGFDGALGVMFDRGIPTVDDPNVAAEYIAVPRQGCAVFLGAIERLRPKPSQQDSEMQFVSIHELGHVFNLQHTVSRLTFMTPSSSVEPYDMGKVFFDEDQCEWLSHCSTSPRVAPGRAPFGDVDPTAPGSPYGHFNVSSPRRLKKRHSGPKLTISMNRQEFFQFEPMNLDVRISVGAGGRGHYSLPAMVDPGYEAFSIYIEDPSGECRRFRPGMQHCPHPYRLRVTNKQCYERDINIFWHSDGYTFKKAGWHRVWVTFQISNRKLLRSNTLDLNIIPELGNDPKRGRLRGHLAHPRVRVLLQHKQDFADLMGINLLQKYLKEPDAKKRCSADIRYALGRACLARCVGRPTHHENHVRSRGKDELKRALDSGRLSAHIEMQATKWLEVD